MSSEIPLTCKVPEAWLEEIDHYAQSQGLSRADVLKAAIAHLLDLQDPNDWSAHFAQLEQHLAKLSRQVNVLHKRLRTVEESQPSLAADPPPASLRPNSAPPSLPPQPASRSTRPPFNGPSLSIPLPDALPLAPAPTASSPPPTSLQASKPTSSISLSTPAPEPSARPSPLDASTPVMNATASPNTIDTVDGELLPHHPSPPPVSPVLTPELLRDHATTRDFVRARPARSQPSGAMPAMPVQTLTGAARRTAFNQAASSHPSNPSHPQILRHIAVSPAPDGPPEPEPATVSDAPPRSQTPPLGTLNLEELCRLNRMNPLTIQGKADAVGLTLAEAIELETGWKYDPRTKTYTPPI